VPLAELSLWKPARPESDGTWLPRRRTKHPALVSLSGIAISPCQRRRDRHFGALQATTTSQRYCPPGENGRFKKDLYYDWRPLVYI
jgi:hypothetical protein